MAQIGFDGIIGQDAAIAAFRAAFERAWAYGRRSGGALIMGRKGGGKTAFIKAAIADTQLPARFADCGGLNRAGQLAELVYSTDDRRGGYQHSFFGDEAADVISGDRAIALDNLGALNKRGRDALTLLLGDCSIVINRKSRRLPFRIWVAASADTADMLDKSLLDLFHRMVRLAPYSSDDLLDIAIVFVSQELRLDYSREALLMAICAPRDAPGEASALLREAERDILARGGCAYVDARIMRETLARLGRTPCGLFMDEYRYLGALSAMGGYGGSSAIAKRLGLADWRALAGLEARIWGLGLAGRVGKAREITRLGEERLAAAEDSLRLIGGG